MDQLKLIAFDADDLHVVSAHLQDAVIRVGDMTFRPHEKRFAAIASRFDWASVHGRGGKTNIRRQAALRTEGVSQVLVEKSSRGYDQHTTERQVAGLTLVRETDELALYDVPDPGKAPDRLPVLPVLLGDLLAAAFGVQAIRRAVRDRRS